MLYHQSVWRWWMCHALATPGYINEWLHCPKCSKKPSLSRMTSRKKPRSSTCVLSSFSSTPSIADSVMVGAIFPHPVVDGVISGDRLAGVAPEPVQDVVLEGAL